MKALSHLGLLSANQRAEHSKALAAGHQLKPGRSRCRLLAQLAENERALFAVHALLVEDIEAEKQITPAGEWLLDNFYVIEEQIRTARRHLPQKYSQELPHLLNTASAGFPRVYDISLAAISYGDGRMEPESLHDVVIAYQSVTILQLGELWAIPIMLRLTLLNKIRNIAGVIATSRMERISANNWADQMITVAAENPKNLILLVADMARSTPALTSSFVSELVRRLRGMGPALALPLTWIEQRLSENEMTIEQLVRAENQLQAASQVSMSNCIGSLRTLDATSWREFVEATSYVEHTLANDPAAAYTTMDFVTRDRYRHVVENLAKAGSCSENEVASKALGLAQAATEGMKQEGGQSESLKAASLHGAHSRTTHVGYYLIDKGLPQLERALAISLSPLALLARGCRKCPLVLYVGSIALLTGIFTAAFVVQACRDSAFMWVLPIIGLLALLGSSHLAFTLVNWVASLVVTPHILPRLDLSKGIPSELRSLVVIPAMLTSKQGIRNLVADLEVRFLANRDPYLHFALLTDFLDAAEEALPEDAALVAFAQKKIAALNSKYMGSSGDFFFLFHRPRLWNAQERVWMGYERKRGKLADLNGYLRGGAKDAFSCVAGDTAALSSVKYVITLDTDTQLPRDSARQFIGTMAHPLNTPLYDETIQRVVSGYGILQPRVVPSLVGNSRSHYAQLCASDMGIDPYTRATSDVYQDVFGEGSFIGKGIYDVDIFEKALHGRFPDNKVLSHDLVEGCYARSGLVSDVHLYEDSPTRYSMDVSRRHRWIRGDWQIARWALPRVPSADGKTHTNPLSYLSRWKIFDNLRRSLTSAALLGLLVFGWGISSSSMLWSLAVIGLVMLPPLFCSAVSMLQKSADMTFMQHLSTSVRMAPKQCSQAAFTLVCLPYEALFSLDAIGRTLWRMFVSHKRMLEWNPSANANQHENIGISSALRRMWIVPTMALVGIGLLAVNPVSGIVSLAVSPLLLFWIVSPFIIWWISQPLALHRDTLTEDQHVFLRKLARKTWSFFETFVGPDDNWLPPDNYQEQPVSKIAHRTSPTNMGFALLANLSAYGFGVITTSTLLARTQNTFETMHSLERYHGHFYNWYDTQTLQPLSPLYVSSVDSGNLVGHLLTLRAGLAEIPRQAIIRAQLFTSLDDALGIAVDSLTPEQKKSWDMRVPLALLQEQAHTLAANPPVTLTAVHTAIQQLSTAAREITIPFTVETEEPPNQEQWWLYAFVRQCDAAMDEFALFFPWIGLPLSPLDADLDAMLTLRDLANLDVRRDSTADSETVILQNSIERASSNAKERLVVIHELQRQCSLFSQVDYGFLYDAKRRLLTIGYNVNENRADAGFYDLLASEARQTSFVAIAQGALPQEHWFALGRLLTISGGEPILLSWSGSMFEYLMPLLVMPNFEHTLLDETCKAAVSRQIAYGQSREIPWGVSECGYNAFDAALNYQYRAFGVPGLGLKRGLAADIVIAPYASALALLVAPAEACANLERMAEAGFESHYGMYEAIDYTPSRLPRGQTYGIVKSFMAHHQGMSLLALAHLLLDAPMQKRFAADPQFQATMLLLQERVPEVTASYAHTSVHPELKRASEALATPLRIFDNPDTPHPEVQLLSNGSYHVMLTNAGGGYSRWQNLALTRWNEDHTRDNWGTFCYIKDMATGEFWSTAYQPTCAASDSMQAIFSEGRVEFSCRKHDYDTHMEIIVASEDNVELRRVRITNRSQSPRTIEVTSFAEVVLAPSAADDLHPAFSKLFVQTQILPEQEAILCTRRPRSENEQAPWMLHAMAVHDASAHEMSYETDRAAFIGRGRSVANPQAMTGGYNAPGTLSGREGSVLDPVVAIRTQIPLDAGQSIIIDMIFGVGEEREAAIALIHKYRDRHIADRMLDMTWTHGQVLLRQLNASEADAQLYSRLAGSIMYANASLRAPEHVLIQNRRGQSGLWGYAISGDLPIVLVKIENADNIDLVRQLLQAHEYWRLKGLAIDLVIWNEDQAGYRQLLHDQIMGIITAGNGANLIDRPGGIFIRATDRIADEDRILIQTVARVILSDSKGTLSEQVQGPRMRKSKIPLLSPVPRVAVASEVVTPEPRTDLVFFNGLGGFTPDGREYVITTAAGSVETEEQRTPAPWVNVLANPSFGTVISESGPAYTWSENAHEFRLTPWGNDPVNDLRGEAFYLRDEERGHFWSPTPSPCCGKTPYVTRHGFGYSVYEHTDHGIYSELWVYVALDGAVKFSSLRVRNICGRPRKLSATGYVEWVLGDLRSKSCMHVVTEIDPASGALLAFNPYNTEFPDRTAFLTVNSTAYSFTGDRGEFIGRNGTLDVPAAMGHAKLSNKVGATLDPCAAIQVAFDLAVGEEREILFTLGVGINPEDAKSLIQRFAEADAASAALDTVWQYWTHTLGAIAVETPDPSFNMLVNGWLMYQTLSCRFFGRSATYQSGGAIGFRDQLQDAMSFIHTHPELLREHILLCAAHQFPEGDVQHWWHPPLARGVRTTCSDDYLWLPLATCRYVLATGDTGVLDEQIHFIQGRLLKANEESYYDLPGRSPQSASLYEHCIKAIENGLKFGEHGLPLMGGGDWNDGMDLVGAKGQGESVWLAFFLYEVLTKFSTVAASRGDVVFSEHYLAQAEKLRENIATHAWDGEWYRRAYFDDGSPLGSSGNPECQIDSIVQSWSVLSEAGETERARMGMDSLDKRLVDREHKLVQLFTPPFDSSSMNPGYIKGYAPGVRENGGQYTHAAIWAAMAFAKLGDTARAWEVLGIINPVNHGRTPEEVAVYKVEPYVMAADVYAAPLHIGRGGWTWYTGSAAWMYRLMTESLLGLTLENNQLHFNPCVPTHWNSFTIHYRHHETTYHITVTQASEKNGNIQVSVDGAIQEEQKIFLTNDLQEHWAEVSLL